MNNNNKYTKEQFNNKMRELDDEYLKNKDNINKMKYNEMEEMLKKFKK